MVFSTHCCLDHLVRHHAGTDKTFYVLIKTLIAYLIYVLKHHFYSCDTLSYLNLADCS
jgi:hypothetical protein